MIDLVRAAARAVRHSRRFYLRLCAWCDRPVAEHARGARRCDHRRALLGQAARWSRAAARPPIG